MEWAFLRPKGQATARASAPFEANCMQLASFFQECYGAAEMQGGYFVAAAARRVNRRRVRNGVHGGNKEQQAQQPNGGFEFQIALEQGVAIPP